MVDRCGPVHAAPGWGAHDRYPSTSASCADVMLLMVRTPDGLAGVLAREERRSRRLVPQDLLRAVGASPPQQRAAVVLHYLEDLLAERLGETLEVVRDADR